MCFVYSHSLMLVNTVCTTFVYIFYETVFCSFHFARNLKFKLKLQCIDFTLFCSFSVVYRTEDFFARISY